MLVNEAGLIFDIKRNFKKHLWEIEYNKDNTIKSIVPYVPIEEVSQDIDI